MYLKQSPHPSSSQVWWYVEIYTNYISIMSEVIQHIHIAYWEIQNLCVLFENRHTHIVEMGINSLAPSLLQFVYARDKLLSALRFLQEYKQPSQADAVAAKLLKCEAIGNSIWATVSKGVLKLAVFYCVMCTFSNDGHPHWALQASDFIDQKNWFSASRYTRMQYLLL